MGRTSVNQHFRESTFFILVIYEIILLALFCYALEKVGSLGWGQLHIGIERCCLGEVHKLCEEFFADSFDPPLTREFGIDWSH